MTLTQALAAAGAFVCMMLLSTAAYIVITAGTSGLLTGAGLALVAVLIGGPSVGLATTRAAR
jgi:uncharacterized membrane protein